MADETPPAEPAAKVDEAPETPTPADEALGEGGKKALEAERARARDFERRLKELEPLAAKAKELEDANKSEAEKTTERLTAAEKRAEKAEGELLRLSVGLEKGLTPAQAKRLVGSTKEELEADADDLLTTFSGDKKAPSTRKPNERLRGGSDPEDPPGETDPRKLAAAIRARRGN